MNWVSVNKELPAYGEPVVLSIKRVTQHITYTLDGADDTPDWFEPYNFEHTSELKLWWNDADYWIYVDDLPKPPE